MDALQSCARKYAELCGYTYDCTIARKNARVSLTFSFSAYEFRHLAGLHRLKHPRLQTNSERLFKDILAGKITLVDLRKASNWEEESEKVSQPIECAGAVGCADGRISAHLWIFRGKAGPADPADPDEDRCRLPDQV